MVMNMIMIMILTVNIEDDDSIDNGVPQVSILGLLHFLIFVNGLSLITQSWHFTSLLATLTSIVN